MAKATAGMTSSITRRWLRGGLLITMVLLVLAETLFLYSTYDNLYGSVRQAMFNRFSTIEGQLRATGTAGDTDETAYSRGRALRRIQRERPGQRIILQSGLLFAGGNGAPGSRRFQVFFF